MESIIISDRTFENARKEIAKNKDKIIVFSSNDDELNRKILEKEKIDVLLLSQSTRKDRIKQRNSGFNQVLAKLAKEKNIAIGINLDEIINSEKKQKQEILARIKQNVKLCSKNKLKMKFITLKDENKRDTYDLKALGLILGMPTWMTSNFTR